MSYTSPAVKNRYNKKAYDSILLTVKKGMKDTYKQEADKRGMSLNEFIRYCVDKEMKSEEK